MSRSAIHTPQQAMNHPTPPRPAPAAPLDLAAALAALERCSDRADAIMRTLARSPRP